MMSRTKTVRENKRKNYVAKAIIGAVDHLLDRLADDDMEIVIKVKFKKEEEDVISEGS